MPALRKTFFPLITAAVIALLNISALAENPAERNPTLTAGFQNPPKTARPSTYYLLLNGYINRDHMKYELNELYQKGIRGLCVFDMGAGRGPKDTLPPKGPAFMSDEWLDNFAYLVQEAGKLGMDVQLGVSSSWDMGASWVQPDQASKALYYSCLHFNGPGLIPEPLPFPDIPGKAPKDDKGRPLYFSEVAVLAFPQESQQTAHEFVVKLPESFNSKIDHVILFNTKSGDSARYGSMHLFAQDFSVAVSQTDTAEASFHQILQGSLKPDTKPQQFDFPATQARYVRLRIYNGHNPQINRVQFAEFEVYSVDGKNVDLSNEDNPTSDYARLVRYNSQAGNSFWTADNIIDGSRRGPRGVWASAGPPPFLIKNLDNIIDLTDRLDSKGHLNWDVPKGGWTILRFICANTGERLKHPSPYSDGLATDHFSSRATEDYLQYIIDRLHKKFGDLSKCPLKQLYLPSYEVRGRVWTPDFPEKFVQYRSYNPTRYLPALLGYTIESPQVTDRFVYDFQKTMGDLLVDAYYRTASTTAKHAGLGIEAESGGPGPPIHDVPVDALKALGAIDEIRGEFWPWRQQKTWQGLWVVKETACAAHIYGRRRVHMESFTGFHHWEYGPFQLKPSADRAFCEGMNHIVWHTCTHQSPEADKPGWVYHAGTHLTPSLIWWPMAKSFIDYLSRCSFLLQQGLFTADVCYYYGDQGSNFVPIKHIDPSLGYGFDYDVTNPEVLLSRMSVKNGRITLPDGMQYELLVLPDRKDIDLQVLKKLAELAQAGATIVGPKPTCSNGLHDYLSRDKKIRQLADSLWGKCDGKTIFENPCGPGKIIWGRTLRDILQARGIGPDFDYAPRDNNPDIDYIHRRTPQADIYFVSNKNNQAKSIDACFRVTGKTPELWSPATGCFREMLVFQSTDRGTRLRLELPPAGSTFVVFRKPADRPHLVSADEGLEVAKVTDKQVLVNSFKNGHYQIETSDGQKINFKINQLPPHRQLSGPWQVKFTSPVGKPESLTFTTLKSWTQNKLDQIRYFSGIAHYEKDVQIPADWIGKNKKLYLDLGSLWAVGEVWLNGQSLGIVWKPPYRVEITDVAKAGSNHLKIDIANTWNNRLVGDGLSPKDQRLCRTPITRSGWPLRTWKDLPLLESGLLGPVTLIPAVEIDVTVAKK